MREDICPHFGTCGGCTLQDLPPDEYRAKKREAVVTALQRAGIEANVYEQAGKFARGGGIAPGGELPVNTGGGQLAGFYLQGMTPLAEAIIQLRGDGGDRQVTGAETALVTGLGGRADHHEALVLARESA